MADWEFLQCFVDWGSVSMMFTKCDESQAVHVQ